MSHGWEQWVGQSIDGKFPLLRYLGGSEYVGVFLTERQDRGEVRQAAIKLVPAPADAGELQLSQWRLAAKLSNSHILRLFETGRCDLGGVPLLYLVMEYADENMARVLPHRALTPAEARILLDSLLDALRYLHDEGFVHGHIKPSNILADGDQVKLSSDTLMEIGEPFEPRDGHSAYDAPEYARRDSALARAASPAGDIWSLAMVLGEALTRNLLTEQASAQSDAPLPATLTEPFADIVRHCLRWQPEDRWTLAQVGARLRGESVRTQPQALPQRARVNPVRPRAQVIKLPRYAIPVGAGFALLIIILAGAKLFHHASRTPQFPAATIDQPRLQPVPQQEPKQQQSPHRAPKADAAGLREDPKIAEPLPASARSEIAPEDSSAGVTKPTASSMAPGAVVQRVLPEVLPSARASIRGTVRVTVRVDVDSSGSVEGATLESRGPSKYFAQLALDSARHWKFAPAKVAGRDVLSRWTLHFAFTRSETTVSPEQRVP